MRITTGTLKSTQLPWLSTLSSIALPHLRRELATQRQHNRLNSTEIETFKQIMKKAITTTRLKSGRPFYSARMNDLNLKEKWKQEWQENISTEESLAEDPTNPQPGFHTLTSKRWTTANRIRIWHDRTVAILHKWGY